MGKTRFLYCQLNIGFKIILRQSYFFLFQALISGLEDSLHDFPFLAILRMSIGGAQNCRRNALLGRPLNHHREREEEREFNCEFRVLEFAVVQFVGSIIGQVLSVLEKRLLNYIAFQALHFLQRKYHISKQLF